MILGFTYDLKDEYIKEGYSEEDAAEFDTEETITGIEIALHNLGFEVQRIGNVKSLVNKLGKGQRWDIVFNICEGCYGIGREAQVPSILEAFGIPYVFSDAFVMALTLHKGLTKQIVKNIGLNTADFFILKDMNEFEKVKIPYPLFIKPVAEGTGKGITPDSKCYTEKELKKKCEIMLKQFKQPVLIETYLSGREFTTGIVGTGNRAKCIGTMEIVMNNNAACDLYTYKIKSEYEQYVTYRIPEKNISQICSDMALKIWQELGCRDGGRVDFRMDNDGNIHFLEINPLAGLNPIHSDLPILSNLHGLPYQFLMEKIMKSAVTRIKKNEQ